jgi:hypothetical protein
MLTIGFIKGLIRKCLPTHFATKTLNILTVTAAAIEAEMRNPVTPHRAISKFFALSICARNFFFQIGSPKQFLEDLTKFHFASE